MEGEEKQSIPAFLPVLPRLDRLELLVKFLEERHSSSSFMGNGRLTAKREGERKTLSSVLVEVQEKGTMMERLAALENRVLKLSLDLDVGSTSGSSCSSIPITGKTGSVNGEDHNVELTRAIKEKESELKHGCERKLRGDGKKRRLRSMEPFIVYRRKLRGWFGIGC